MEKLKFNIFLFSLFFFCIPISAAAGVITSDTVWDGDVIISEDILVPEGITLTIRQGTVIKIAPSESTKTDPEYMSPLTEITIRGTLKAEGTEETPIVFLSNEKEAGSWAGIIIDKGTAHLKSCRIQDAETGIYVIKGSLWTEDVLLKENRYGIVAQGEGTSVKIKSNKITENDYGIFTLGGAKVDIEESLVKGNKKKDVHNSSIKKNFTTVEYNSGNKEPGRYYGDEVLLGETIWQGRVMVDGMIRVPERGRLIIMPGTIIEFRRKETNGDGIGENGLLIQGLLIAKGTIKNPIIFRSAEKNSRMGDWDAINIMNSDGAQNLIEYCQIEDAYRGLHFHFSNVAVRKSVLRNNYRGIQFQESAVEIAGNYFYGNKSGVQARDSEIIFENNFLYDNYYGAHFFRTTLVSKGNKILNNIKEGLRIREGFPVVEENIMDGNRYGLMVTDSIYGDFKRNVVTNNLEAGMLFKHTDNIEVSENFIQGNGINGINIQDSRAVIKGNNISGNGERGIGIVSFDGIITENNFVKNGTYAVGLDSKMNISAPMNWWGNDAIEDIIYDRNDDPGRGRVEYKSESKTPIPYTWPLQTISSDTAWYGDIGIRTAVQVLPGAVLTLMPGTNVIFSEGAGLKINGKIIAKGQKDSRIIFTSTKKKGPSDWDEILLEHATDSIFFNCDFEYATWGIHSHFTNLVVTGSSFRKNYGGIRFQSGPVAIKQSLFEGNSVGIRSFRGRAVIEENVITGNETGFFVREKGGGLTIKRNNIFANSDYNLRIGDFNNEDVNARENYWGSGEPGMTIFDDRKEPGIGRVHFNPYAKEPFKPGREKGLL